MNKIVFTGGPCAGKTEIINYLKEELEKRNYKVFIVSETAAELLPRKTKSDNTYSDIMDFQNLILKYQYAKENLIEEYIGNDDVIILYDRALLDGKAYLERHEDFNTLLNQNNLSEINLVDKYNYVINLLSTATLNSNDYKTNEIRLEDKTTAEKLDRKTTFSWILHNNIELIKPTEKFEDKMKIVLEKVLDSINKKQKINIDKKEIDYNGSNLLTYDETNSKTIILEEIEIFINDNNKKIILSKRIYNDKISFLLTSYYTRDNEEYVYENIPLSKDDFLTFLTKHKVKNVKNKIITKFIDDDGLIKSIEKEDEKSYLLLPKGSKVPSNIKIKNYDRNSKTLLKK